MKQEFDAIIKQHEGMNAAYVDLPFDVEEVFGAKRVKIVATFDGAPYRGSIVRMGGGYWLGVTQAIRAKIGKGFGDVVHVTVECDEGERSVDVPPDLQEALDASPAAWAGWEALSYSYRKDYAAWINGAKRAETRTRRIERAIPMIIEKKRLK
ncbi:MAG TPA: DUF1905 domain-containing protein [Chloroflexi bacterium]|jgi:hypothetical protein|nr:DUF1905 domain-containing protein [Chloroflexota bacterium]